MRLDPSDTIWDQEVIDVLDSSVERVEHDSEKVMIKQTFEKRLFQFPSGSEGILLDREPIIEITEVKYIPQGGGGYVNFASFQLDDARRAVFPSTGSEWPSTETRDPQGVVITFDAGYGESAGAVPRELLQAVKLSMTQRFYQEDTQTQYSDLLRPHRRSSYP